MYEIVRWWRRLWWAWGSAETTADRDHLLRIWCLWWGLHKGEWPQMIWESLPTDPVFDPVLAQQRYQSELPRAVRESIPDWLDQWASTELGERWEALISHLNTTAPVDLRVNTLKASRDQVLARLQADGFAVQAVAGSEVALTLLERKNLFVTKTFHDGWFEVQDRGSQLISALLPVKPGMRVIDACAGSGGKTLHLAARMQNRGKILALDIHQGKLNQLRERASRNGVQMIETRWIDSTKVVKRLVESADAVLLDVPCSGLGVLRRHPDTKWKLQKTSLEHLWQQQQDILQLYSKMTKPKGFLVYATCSILPSENELQVQKFLHSNTGWNLYEQHRWDPEQGQSDGFFAALLQRD